MTPVFADTLFYVALLNHRDALHQTALDYASQSRIPIVTTEFVLLEVANFFKQAKDRGKFGSFVQALRNDPATTIIACDSTWFQRGLDCFTARLDKEWSLTDCISFVIMETQGLNEAVTADHHFEQAGFKLLL